MSDYRMAPIRSGPFQTSQTRRDSIIRHRGREDAHMTPEHLAERVDAYLKETGISRSAFGVRVANDRNLVFQLQRGRNVTLLTANKILAAIEETEG